MSIVCCYCHKPCDTAIEIERAWVHPVNGHVTCCNSCGGYENCPECGKLWENLQSADNAPCFECVDKLTEKTN